MPASRRLSSNAGRAGYPAVVLANTYKITAGGLLIPVGQIGVGDTIDASVVNGDVLVVGPTPADISATPGVGSDSQYYRCHTAAAAITITMPASPYDGMRILVADIDGDAHVNPITVKANTGQFVANPYQPTLSFGPASSVSIRIDNQCVEWVYDANNTVWYVVHDSASGQLPSYSVAAGGTINLQGRAFVKVNTTGGTHPVVNMPSVSASPGTQDDMTVAVKDISANAATNSVTVNPTGTGWQIENPTARGTGSPVAGVGSLNGQCTVWIADATAKIWWILNTG